MNSENSRIPTPHILLLKPTNKLDLRLVKSLLLYQILVFIIHGKI